METTPAGGASAGMGQRASRRKARIGTSTRRMLATTSLLRVRAGSFIPAKPPVRRSLTPPFAPGIRRGPAPYPGWRRRRRPNERGGAMAWRHAVPVVVLGLLAAPAARAHEWSGGGVG